MNDLNYFEDLSYNSNALDEALDDQHIINMRYHELLAEKNEEVNEQRRKLKISEIEVKKQYARFYLIYKKRLINGKSPTENSINSSILTDSEYKKVQKNMINEIKKLNELLKQSEILDGVVKSFQQRKNCIEKQVELWICGYHGQIRQKDVSKKVQESIKQKLNRKN